MASSSSRTLRLASLSLPPSISHAPSCATKSLIFGRPLFCWFPWGTQGARGGGKLRGEAARARKLAFAQNARRAFVFRRARLTDTAGGEAWYRLTGLSSHTGSARGGTVAAGLNRKLYGIRGNFLKSSPGRTRPPDGRPPSRAVLMAARARPV